MRSVRKNSVYDVYFITQYLYQCYSNNLFWVVPIAQLVDAVISSVVEVLSLNPGLGHKNFSAFNGIVDLLYLSISVFKSV